MGRSARSKYVVRERLGEGELATVYRAALRAGGPDKAFKLIHPEFATDPDFLARCVQERTRILALRGSNVVAVDDIVAEPGQVAIVMELVTGGTLRHYLDLHGAQNQETSLQAIRHVLRGLGIVHGHEMVHGDVKPQNVLLSSDAAAPGMTAKISDFGISRLLGRRLPATADDAYTAPEIAAGGPRSTAGDVYAAGVVLHELVTGALPTRSLLRPPTMSDEVWSLLDRWLSPDPADRPADAWTALAAVDAVLPEAALQAELLRAPAVGTYIGAGFGFRVAAPEPVLDLLPDQAELARVGAPEGALRSADARTKTLDLTSAPAKPDFAGPARLIPPSRLPIDWLDADANQPTSKRGRRSRWRKIVAFGSIGVVLGACGFAAATFLARQKPAPHISLRLPVETFPSSGVTLIRTWTITGGSDPVLHGSLAFRTTGSVPSTVEEVLPASLGSAPISFSPKPVRVTGHVVRYQLPGVADLTVTDTYDVPLPRAEASMAGLQRLAKEQRLEAAALERVETP